MDSLINFTKSVNTTDFTLILPSVSVGNVGQLTVDLLISSQGFEKFATVWDPAIIPSVGSDPFSSGSAEVCTACELYVNESLQIVAMQLRSSIEHRLAGKFFEKLKRMITDLKFKEVIILTSSFAHEMHNVTTSPFRYITNRSSNEDVLNGLNVLPVEAEPSGRYTVYGAGFATNLYEVLGDALQCTVLVKYSSEGDNRPDALQMLDILYGVKAFAKLNSKSVQFPHSWQFVFGNPPPVGIY